MLLGGNLTLTEYVGPTVKRRTTEGKRSGMEAGIAEKSGNADGAKATTVVDRKRTNINYTPR